MFDIPDAAVLDQDTLIGGCVRLPLLIDAPRLQQEARALPAETWGTTGGRYSVHMAAEAVFLRGYAPSQGEKPVEDRPELDRVPGVREFLALVDAPPMRCLLARLPPGGYIAPHMDQAPYFRKTVRLHVPVETHEHAWMMAAGKMYSMREGEVWALNNSAVHAVWNRHPTLARTHLICDFLPSPPLLDLLSRGERDLGRFEPAFDARIAAGARR